MAAAAARALGLCFLLLLTIIADSSAADGGASQYGDLGWIGGSGGCRGTIAECLASGGDDEEFDLGSEVSRRILANTRYISYGALRRDTVPCNRRGASYYNCRPGAYANPYHRGCSAITRCRS